VGFDSRVFKTGGDSKYKLMYAVEVLQSIFDTYRSAQKSIKGL